MARLRLVFIIITLVTSVIACPLRALAQSPVQTEHIDPFGQEVTLPERPIIYVSGTGSWDGAYETIREAFKTLKAYADSNGITPAGPALTIYTAMDDMSFNFQAALPLAALPGNAPVGNVGSGMAPSGKALKFVHRGSFDALAQTYDSIAHYVEEKQISTRELLIEEYTTDILTTPADSLVINIYVPLN